MERASMQKRIAWQRDIYFGEKIPCVNRAAELVRLLYAVSAEVSMNPQLYATRDKVLWAYLNTAVLKQRPS